MIDIFSLSANKLVEKLKAGEVSSVEVCTQYIDRIKNFEKDVKAWAHFDKKELLEKAAEADEYRKSGKPLGALHGLPVAVKDIIGTLDMPTECGTVIRKKMTGSQEAEVVNLLKIAGAIIMGKTETTELAYFHPGKTTNPHDYSRTPGGSSSGSAAAVAVAPTDDDRFEQMLAGLEMSVMKAATYENCVRQYFDSPALGGPPDKPVMVSRW